MFRQLQSLTHPRPREERIFYALRDLNFQITRGEWVGLVGNNGSGKSTLLKVIAGLYPPSQGKLQVRGEVALLSGLGIGMVGLLSVRDNVYLSGAIHGLTQREVRAVFDEIIAWAELEEFVQANFITLSSGMRSRLGFSVSRYGTGEIVLQDEALSAGDKDFAAKCRAYYQAARSSGKKTFVVASHDLNFIEEFCPRTLWLAKGKQMAFGDTAEVLKEYRAYRA